MAAEGEYLELRSRRRSSSRCAVAKAEQAWTIHGHGKLTVRTIRSNGSEPGATRSGGLEILDLAINDGQRQGDRGE
ncbi:hypothetical protein OsI_14730 [Oryza sativa Indica Group]|uniref:Uncharacterized protein n=1 Tax=Oryza sativa subsp. indica TaxID=39946 RepID=A2XQ20_ORYSI|nr:hypothetical protein OsI_14730 [Oryza sativa Indica Group]